MKLKRIKKVVSKVSSILIIILLTISLYNFVSIKLLKKDLVEVFGYAMLEVVSGSMEPTIGVGDLIIINTNYKNLKKDDYWIEHFKRNKIRDKKTLCKKKTC